MVKCPRCGREAEVTGEEWKYSAFHVKLYGCPSCGKGFNPYYRENKLSRTIAKTYTKLQLDKEGMRIYDKCG